MLKLLIGWIVKSKVAKVGGGLIGGSTVLTAVIWPLFTFQAGKVDAQFISADKEIRQYVDLKHENVLIELNLRHENVLIELGHFKAGQGEIKELLKITNQRLYILNKGN